MKKKSAKIACFKRRTLGAVDEQIILTKARVDIKQLQSQMKHINGATRILFLVGPQDSAKTLTPLLSNFMPPNTTNCGVSINVVYIHRMIPCPRSVFVYNSYIGATDNFDSMLGFYLIRIRSKKRIFYVFLIVALKIVGFYIEGENL